MKKKMRCAVCGVRPSPLKGNADPFSAQRTAPGLLIYTHDRQPTRPTWRLRTVAFPLVPPKSI